LAADEAGTLLTETYKNTIPVVAGVLLNAPEGSAAIQTVWTRKSQGRTSRLQGVIAEQKIGSQMTVFDPFSAANEPNGRRGATTVDVYLGHQLIQTLDFQVAGGSTATVGKLSLHPISKTAPIRRPASGPRTLLLDCRSRRRAEEGVPVRVVWTPVNAKAWNELQRSTATKYSNQRFWLVQP